jgi:hypothetical protein
MDEEERIDSDDPWHADGGDELEAEIMRANRPFGSSLRGTTPEEAIAGEGLEEALAQEQPEGPTIEEALELEDDGVPDLEDELVADGSVVREEFASPEESALTVRDDVPGATDHEDPHDDDED